jgi:SAM-dependent methyltransferase
MRTTFDSVAADYERVRPTYPPDVYADLVDLAALSPGTRLVEVGPGTGQATIPLAERGFRIVAVELGAQLAALARQRLAGFPGVEIVSASFEEWEPPVAAAFDGVVSFAAFHWVDPEVSYAKAAHLLKAGGSLSVFDWQDTLPHDGDPFFAVVVEDYAAIVPDWEAEPPPPPDEVADRDRIKVFMDASGCFEPAAVRHYVWSVSFTAADFAAFLGTTGSVGALDLVRRSLLLARIQERIETQHGGTVRKHFLGTLAVGRVLR